MEREQLIKVLNEVLATELVCVLRYKRHYYTASGIHSEAVREEFLEHAREEQEHADWVAERIAVETYLEIVRWLGNEDSTTRVLIERILAKEEEHAEELSTLLQGIPRHETDGTSSGMANDATNVSG